MAAALSLIGIAAATDLDRAFIVFHSLFFPGKDNWIFDQRTDPIIRLMPEEFFRNCAILILALLILAAAVIMLADLRKKFTAIDTLIAKMKHRDELEPVYKEYQGKSGWSQSRFKKKNAATIEDYEATVEYIKEHIKRYAVDGKQPTMLDLLEKSNKLKSKWNRLNVEHTAFLTKRETAKKYTRQVRQYINEQQMKREREKYRQKKLTQQRKKDTLE